MIYRSTQRGFTLIELLVVVLIIGILAAVALPQYQKAVEKSRATTIFPLLRSIGDAQENYYMENGTYAMSFNELVLDIPFTGTIKGMTFYPLRDVRSNEDWSIQLYPDLNAVFASRLTGPYAGAAFAYQYGDWSCVPGNSWGLCAHMLTCVIKTETAGGVFLDRKQYSKYCEKIFKTTRTVESISIGSFRLMP